MTIEEVRVHSQKLTSDPEFEPDFSQLIDATGITSSEISPEDEHEIATNRRFAEKTRHAFVFRNEIDPCLAVFMAIHDEAGDVPSRLRLFTDFQSAIRWLGQNEDAISLL